jgi:hypothetical protein
VDEVAGWQARARDRIAHALADVLTSAQAVTLQMSPGLGSPTTGVSTQAVGAAADIGAHLLEAAVQALDEGRDLHRGWADRLAELPYRGAPDTGPGRFDATIQLSH